MFAVPSVLRSFALSAWRRGTVGNLRNVPLPTGPTRVHTSGLDPDRVLLIGDGPAVGHGVMSHDLALPGQLARQLTSHTGRATDVEVIPGVSMTVRQALEILKNTDLERFDAIVTTLGSSEALTFVSVSQWRADVTDLLDYVQHATTSKVHLYFVSIPASKSIPDFPEFASEIVDRHIDKLNDASEILCEGRSRAALVQFESLRLRRYSAKNYETWASFIAPKMLRHLEGAGRFEHGNKRQDEELRQQAVDRMSTMGTDEDEKIDDIVSLAKSIFDCAGAAVTIIDHDRSWSKAAKGVSRGESPREFSFCNTTIKRPELFVVESALEDPRFADFPAVTGPDSVRFYAGYPLETPDGARVGALCIIDNKPRSLTKSEATLLRDLALKVQDVMWERAGVV